MFGFGSAAKKHLTDANAAMKTGDLPEALRALQFGFKADSGNKTLYSTAAQVLRKMGEPTEAAYFETALRNFKDPAAFYDLGYHFVDSGNPIP